MKNFLHKKDHAPVCPNFRIYFNVSTDSQHYINEYQKLQLQSFAALLLFIRFVFFRCHQQILYRIKIKSPE